MLEEIGKYYYVCKWMEGSPVQVKTYLAWWIAPALAIGITYALHLETSLVSMVAFAGIVFVLGAASELKKEGGVREMLRNRK